MFDNLRQPVVTNPFLMRGDSLNPFEDDDPNSFSILKRSRSGLKPDGTYNHRFMFSQTFIESLDVLDILAITDEYVSREDIRYYIHANTSLDILSSANEFTLGGDSGTLKTRFIHDASEFTYPLNRNYTQHHRWHQRLLKFNKLVETQLIENFLACQIEYLEDNDTEYYIRNSNEWSYVEALDMFVVVNGSTNNRGEPIMYIGLYGHKSKIEATEECVDRVISVIRHFAEKDNIVPPPPEFQTTIENRHQLITEAETRETNARHELQARISEVLELRTYRQTVLARSEFFLNKLEEFKRLPEINPQYQQSDAFIVTQSGTPFVVLKALRKRSVLRPYANRETALDTLDDAQRSRLESQMDEDDYYDATEHPDYIYLENYDPEFVMPKAVVQLRIHLDAVLKITNWELWIAAANKTDGVESYWGGGPAAHPHAGNNRTPCFGDFSPPLMDAVNNHDFLSVFAIANIFCDTYNQDDEAGEHVIKWENIVDALDRDELLGITD